ALGRVLDRDGDEVPRRHLLDDRRGDGATVARREHRRRLRVADLVVARALGGPHETRRGAVRAELAREPLERGDRRGLEVRHLGEVVAERVARGDASSGRAPNEAFGAAADRAVGIAVLQAGRGYDLDVAVAAHAYDVLIEVRPRAACGARLRQELIAA